MLSAIAFVIGGSGLALVTLASLVARRELAALVRVPPAPLMVPLLVVIPARDEADGIGACLQRVLSDRCAALRVLVVDDRSSDQTAAIVMQLVATDARLTLLRLEEDPPADSFGKPRALALGVEHVRATGALPERVLFLDADVLLEEGALGGLLCALEASRASALSGLPHLDCRTLLEQLLLPTIVPLLVGRLGPTRVHDDSDAAAFLNGQLILVDTAAYQNAGGFAAVCHTVLEDVALARALKGRGHRLRLGDLRALASTRMYCSWRGIVEGFGKNATALLGPHAWATGILSLSVSLLPLLAVVLALASKDAAALAGALALLIAAMAVQVLARRRTGAPLWPVLVLPLAYAGVAWVLVRASWRTLRGHTTQWKGRDYPGQRAP